MDLRRNHYLSEANPNLNLDNQNTNENLSIIESFPVKSKFSVDEHKAIENNICIICYEKNMDSVIQPCGHGGMCYTCSLLMWKDSLDCHICRAVILLLFIIYNYFRKLMKYIRF